MVWLASLDPLSLVQLKRQVIFMFTIMIACIMMLMTSSSSSKVQK